MLLRAFISFNFIVLYGLHSVLLLILFYFFTSVKNVNPGMLKSRIIKFHVVNCYILPPKRIKLIKKGSEFGKFKRVKFYFFELVLFMILVCLYECQA